MILHGDCREVMATLEANSVDAIVSDPPYGLSFMGKGWDHGVPGVEFWVEALRVAKPGAHVLAFGGTRTYHRLACAIEDAGWEVRDCIAWVYGSGFPKSLDIAKALAKRAGGALRAQEAIEFMREERERIGLSRIELEKRIFGRSDGNVRNWEDGISIPVPGLWPRIRAALGLTKTPFDEDMEDGSIVISKESGSYGYQRNGERWAEEREIRVPGTDLAAQWAGWGTALKPAYEPIIVARKPLLGTVASNVMQYGTGGINVDGCRVGTEMLHNQQKDFTPIHGNRLGSGVYLPSKDETKTVQGRWPANFIHDGSDEVVGLFPETKSGDLKGQPRTENKIYGSAASTLGKPKMFRDGDSGSAARFFYCAKASKADRDAGCEGMEERLAMRYGEKAQGPLPQQTPSKPVAQRNHHPTVKPTDLMRYLCRLVTPPGGTVLDPFCGSGSTGKGAILEGFNFIGIEREAEYVEIAKARTEWARKQYQPKLF